MQQITSVTCRSNPRPGNPCPTLTTGEQMLSVKQDGTRFAVRRLMPVELERLQGFEDGYTDIPWRGRDHAPDGPRAKAIGNSWAVPVVRWIGRRIEAVKRCHE